jgi:GntR family transcriptional regulator
VATGTVARAYSELEAAGLIASRRRTGTVVLGGPPARAAEAEVRRAAGDLAARAHAAGLPDDAVLAIVRAALLQRGLTRPG